MFATLMYTVVALKTSWGFGVGGWSLYMDPLHLHLKVQ